MDVLHFYVKNLCHLVDLMVEMVVILFSRLFETLILLLILDINSIFVLKRGVRVKGRNELGEVVRI